MNTEIKPIFFNEGKSLKFSITVDGKDSGETLGIDLKGGALAVILSFLQKGFITAEQYLDLREEIVDSALLETPTVSVKTGFILCPSCQNHGMVVTKAGIRSADFKSKTAGKLF